MGDVSILVAEIQATGFDVTSADALVLLDRRHKVMCARARYWRMTRPATVTTVIQANGINASTVPVPDDIVELFRLEVPGTPEALYQRTLQADLPAMLDGSLNVGGGGVFTETPPTTTVTGTTTLLALYPPVLNGTIVSTTCAVTPPTLNTAETAGGFLRVPVMFYEPLLAGVYSALLSRPNEARADLAAPQEQAFNAGCDELRDRADRRFGTRGPRQIRT